MAECSVPECARRPRSRFQPLCGMHYERQRLTGTTERSTRTEADRFWSKVSKTDTCWLWTAALTHGYGTFRRSDGGTIGAHRFAWESLVGPIPDGMQVDHVCHNDDPDCLVVLDCLHRRCVRPSHLRLASNAENSRAGKGGEINAQRLSSSETCDRGHPLRRGEPTTHEAGLSPVP